jgi:predicted ATPase/DNA-binding CsgD family transcriptional regulator
LFAELGRKWALLAPLVYRWYRHGEGEGLVGAGLSAAELRARRLGLGMTQRQLAADLGVTPTTLARWERGERAISNPVLVRLALDHLGDRAAAARRPVPLPAPATELIGRDRELASLTALLADPAVRLVTLTGAGGAGKTVLALAALRRVASQRTDGACLVELADLPAGAPAEAVAAAFAAALGVREAGGEPLARTLAQALRGSDMLLLADNCEHVAAASADLVAALVTGCPRVTVLATSREPLRIRAERRFGVPPLRVPDLARLPAPAALARVPSVRLFVTRWSAADPGFRLTSAQAHAVGEICVRLDGLPLALELAAAHGRPLSPTALLTRLDALPELPGTGHRDMPQRHRSLRTVLDWSYDLLDPAVQAVFSRLGVFAGGFDAAAAAEVTGPDAGHGVGVDGAVDMLTEANLVVRYQTTNGTERLRLLEPVRSYARERLVAAGGLHETAKRHAIWLAGWAEANAAKFENELQLSWLDELEAEIANLRAALAWSRSQGGDADLGLRLAAAMRRYWDMRGLPSEARDLFSALLAAASGEPAPARLYALIELAGLAVSQEDADAIERHALAAARIAAQLDDKRGAANASELLTYVAFLRGDLASAAELAERSLSQATEAGHALAVAHARMARGVVAFGSGMLDAAVADLEHALDHARDRKDRWFTGECASVLAHVHLARGDYQTARTSEAESLAARVALKNRPALAVNLKIIGIADAATGNAARAVVLFAGAAAIEETTSPTWQSHWLDAYHRAVAAAREALGPRFAELHAFGLALAETEVVKIALLAASAVPLPGRAVGWSANTPERRGGTLTLREDQVSELITEGLTSQEIAVRLGIAKRTADAHTEHIMTKLGVHSRAQVAAWVERNRAASLAYAAARPAPDCAGPSVASWAGTRLAARAEIPIPAATAAMRPLTPRQTQALRNGSRARCRARLISVREMLGAG